jgi:hypothetical protein
MNAGGLVVFVAARVRASVGGGLIHLLLVLAIIGILYNLLVGHRPSSLRI